jgi:hypothetical protein
MNIGLGHLSFQRETALIRFCTGYRFTIYIVNIKAYFRTIGQALYIALDGKASQLGEQAQGKQNTYQEE